MRRDPIGFPRMEDETRPHWFYTYGDPNHAHAVTATSDGSTFAYNADGDMTTRNLAGQAPQTLAWNEDHRLDHVKEGSSVQAEFIYGLNDVRLRRVTGDTYTYYHADGTEYTWDNSTNTGVFTYYHQIGGKTVAYTTSNDSKTMWMYSDQINSTSLTRDDTGLNKIQRYTPWGETRTNGNFTTDHTYTGQIEDQTTGLRYYNARYQDPAIGRFISPDTIIPDASNGQDYNRYTYVTNNPVKYLDPSGHCLTVSDDGLCEIYGNGWKFEQRSKSPFSYKDTGRLTTTDDAVAALLSGGGERLRYVESGYAPAPEPDLIDLYSLSFPVVGADSQAAAFEEAQRIVNQVRSEPNSHFPFPVELADCTGGDCGTPISVGNVLSLTSDNFLVPGPVLVTEVHKYGWSFEALPGHIAAGGTVEFYIAPGSYAGVETVRLTVSADGQKGSLEATSPVFAEASGRFLWSQMAASMNCSARNAETGVARC